jgi:hypothetical protein
VDQRFLFFARSFDIALLGSSWYKLLLKLAQGVDMF